MKKILTKIVLSGGKGDDGMEYTGKLSTEDFEVAWNFLNILWDMENMYKIPATKAMKEIKHAIKIYHKEIEAI